MKKNVKSEIKKSYPEKILRILNLISNMAEEREVRVFLVGGMVRDLLLDNPSIDLDIAIQGGSGIEFAKHMAQVIKAELKVHPKFNTASIKLDENLKMDVATCRKETYSTPGALPEIESASIKEDLYRRDFTINAIAISFNKKTFGDIIDYYGGTKDLESGLIRVIHKDSFKDDPTRILRAIRFVSRLDFNLELSTEKLMLKAIKKTMLDTISKDRVRDEIKLLLQEKECDKQIEKFNDYIGLNFIHPNLKLDQNSYKLFNKARDWLNRYRREIQHDEIKDWIINFTILIEGLNLENIKQICKKFNFSNEVKDKIVKYKEFKLQIPNLLKKEDELKPSQVYKILNPLPLESVFVILCRPELEFIKDKIWSFLTDYRFINLEINGNDLKEMGAKPGPKFDTILTKVLCAKIDQKVRDKQDELKLAKKLIN